jgi:LCP family protein required for cell wall assembly
LAGVLSALVPGAGQWYAGRRRRALVFLALIGLAPLGAAFLAGRGTDWLLEVVVQPRWLWVLFAANIVVVVLRLFAALDAYVMAGGRLLQRPGSVVGALVLAGVIIAPHVVVADYALEAIDLLETVFVADEPPPLSERIDELLEAGVDPDDLGPPASTTTAAPEATTTVVSTTTTSNPDGSSDEDPLGATTTTEAESAPSWEAPFTDFADRFGLDRVTVLLAGGDAGPGRWSLRTDVMIVATVDLTTRKAVLFGLSRDLAEAPLPDEINRAFLDMELDYAWRQEQYDAEQEGRDPVPVDPGSLASCRCFPDRLNAIWTYTNTFVRTYPDSPDPGMEALRRTLGILLGIRVDYYVLVDFAGFVDLIDAIGGVDVTLAAPMDVAYSPAKEGEDPVAIDLPAGTHHLDGRTALAYVRDRSDANDAARMVRQRCMLRAVADATDAGTLLTRFPDIAEAVRATATTNIPIGVLPDLIRIASSLESSDVATQAIGYPQHSSGINWKGLPLVDVGDVQATVQQALEAAAAGGTGEVFTADECG